MEKQKKELEEHRFEEATATNKTIKEQVRKDKLEWKLDELKAADEKGYKWDGLKRLKSKFTPRFSKFKDKDCRHVPVDKYAETKTQNILKRYNGPLQWTSPRQRDLPRSLRRTEGRSRIRTSLHRSSILLWISW